MASDRQESSITHNPKYRKDARGSERPKENEPLNSELPFLLPTYEKEVWIYLYPTFSRSPRRIWVDYDLPKSIRNCRTLESYLSLGHVVRWRVETFLDELCGTRWWCVTCWCYRRDTEERSLSERCQEGWTVMNLRKDFDRGREEFYMRGISQWEILHEINQSSAVFLGGTRDWYHLMVSV